jgi:hypothetical protein
MWAFVLWACAMTGLRCDGATPPDATVIQAAYEREASNGSKLHSRNLRVTDAACGDPTEGKFLCQVTFLSTDDPAQRLYFDIVIAVRNGEGWELTSGLCKR